MAEVTTEATAESVEEAMVLAAAAVAVGGG